MITSADLLSRGHQAMAEHRFGDAYASFEAAERLGELSAHDVVAWSDAAWWLGRADRALQLAELGHHRLLAAGAQFDAAKGAVGLGFLLMLRGDLAAGSGWLQRGRSLLERSPEELAHGYVVQLDAEMALAGGDLDRAVELSRTARRSTAPDVDPALWSMTLMTEGTATLRSGAVAEGMALVDEAMLPVTAGLVPPDMAGNLYCQMISLCWDLADLRRAREWTDATQRWCEQFDGAVMFSGICRMHRVQLSQVAGRWDAAAEEARVVCTELVGMNAAVVAEGHYLLGDLHRLRGHDEPAETAYRRAHELGRDPQPGLALLRAQQGQHAAALTTLRMALDSHEGSPTSRAPLLRAVVDVAAAVGDVDAADAAATALEELAVVWTSDGMRAAAAECRGAVDLAAGEPAAAVPSLRAAVRRWLALDAPHDRARARVRLAEALHALGAHDAAELELETAEETLAGLGATVDLARVRRLRSPQGRAGALTAREAEILALVAEGRTNQQVADALVISEKTVARHLANTYLKLGVSNRTAASAWARMQGLGPGP